jgi:5-methylcytosine-specific restriction endonuclease McrA
MSWAKVDDRANEHTKQLDAGPEACWFWVCGLMFVNRNPKRNGVIPDKALAMLYPVKSPKKLADKLVEVGLWERIDGGYRIHDFEEWNETAEERDERLGIAARRRALRNDPDLYQKLKTRDGLSCRYCGDAVNFSARRGPKSGTYDHVVPVVQGGVDGIDNLVVCCQACNLKKGGRTPDQADMKLRPVPSSVPRSVPSSVPRSVTNAEPKPKPDNAGSTPLHSKPLQTTTTPEQKPIRVVVTMADKDLPLAERARKVLENPMEGQWLNPGGWPETLRANEALSLGFKAGRLGDYPDRDADLRSILQLFRDGHTADSIEELGKKARDSDFIRSKKRVGPAFFTPSVVRRLLAEGTEPDSIEVS